MKSGSKESITLVQRLLAIEESRRHGEPTEERLDEVGTPTTALPPSTDATRQLAQDQATSGQPAIAPVGAVPSLKNPTLIQTQVDDEPVHDQPGPGQDTGHGLTIPQDRRGDYEAETPATDTMSAEGDPGSDTSRQAERDIKLAMNKGPYEPRVESMDSMDEIVEFLIEAFGGPEALAWQLYTDGAPYELSQSIAEGELDWESADERIMEFLIEMAMAIEDEFIEASIEEEELDEAVEIVEALFDLSEDEIYGLVEALVAEGFGATLKKGIAGVRKVHKTLAAKPGETKKVKLDRSSKPSTPAGKRAMARAKLGNSPRVVKSEKVSWADTGREGADARRNK